ncbi:DUF6160 family protein [uncultured Alcanivorax sp.]|jgi:hypothetical protein|uniref:DUF6160 family protein n=1 Tax=uncultured Alcanivorax sp. TaxID=191215 RepID=UPI002635109D|nr:DUF6160 family protein [uncultured Alcanivorax sp.]
MNFKKLALAAAVAVAPMSALALEPMQDEALSGVTGQDGISIGLNLDATLNVGIEDTDGFAGNTGAGMILIENMGLSTGTGDLNLVIDSASSGSGGGVLQVSIQADALTVNTGDLYVGQGTDGTDVAAGIAKVGTELTAVQGSTFSDPILESVSVTLNDLELSLQLGSEASNLFAISTTSVLSIEIGTLADGSDNLTLNDAAGGGALSVDQLALNNLDVDGITGQVTTSGLVINTNGALSGVEVAAMGVQLGTADSIGNVYVTGLDLSNTAITIAGH